MIVLFVCTGNTCRSPMAEGILKSIAKEKKLSLEVKSAGISVFDGDNASKNSIEAMRKIGIDISKHKARQLHRDLVDEADLILTMSRSHKEIIISNFPTAKDKICTLLEYVYKIDKDIADPYGGNLLLYEHTREEIYKAIEKIIDNGQLTIN
ncbi:low molecular weight protein arginine phosphatase [Tissierella carlieri]|uniref:Low molecular weight protein arginine phosphatase n=1 Tax=Tissierella carlieri TaxID=689904 RepID=A0ABT1S9L3_9FIRM|nr:low molecular weight protein arginine phosphatase [Tissierella carlieri]MCQ4923168.1 low molecular weight protein arginine phosphatase [Tissierella carlieri]